MRKLATIQQIREIKPIEGADAIELALIKGWQCVVKKGEFQKWDMCVYFEVDCFLPIDERYEFLRRSSYRNNEFMGEGFRIKTMTMRGELSQGLVLPLSAFPEIESLSAAPQPGTDAADSQDAPLSAAPQPDADAPLSAAPQPVADAAPQPGTDVTKLLGVRKWDQPETVGNMGAEIGEKPFGIPTTDETRLQSMPEFLDVFKGLPYYITTKMDGTSCTVYCMDGQVGVCGRNFEYKEDAVASAMWALVYKRGLKDKLLALGENIAIQGEFCGAGIQKNRMKLMEPKLFVFDIVMLFEGGGGKKVGLEGLRHYCGLLSLDMVPIEEEGDNFDYTLPELLEKARGKYSSGQDKEGIVVRTQEAGHNREINHKMSFKVLNNDFLKKEKD